jgi:hypothetical protein
MSLRGSLMLQMMATGTAFKATVFAPGRRGAIPDRSVTRHAYPSTYWILCYFLVFEIKSTFLNFGSSANFIDMQPTFSKLLIDLGHPDVVVDHLWKAPLIITKER